MAQQHLHMEPTVSDHPDPLDVALTHTTSLVNVLSFANHGIIACPNAGGDFRKIWSPEIEARRAERIVHAPSRLTLGGCVSLSVTPRSPAHLAIATGRGAPRVTNDQIVHLQTSARHLIEALIGFGVVDRNALARDASITIGIEGLARLDWALIKAGDFSRSADDPSRVARMGAEVLVRGCLPFALVERIVCWDDDVAAEVRAILRQGKVDARVEVKPNCFFKAGS